jgi:hypothetical protein
MRTANRYGTLDAWVSPIGLAMFSYALFLVAWLFPPGAYSNILGEPDKMFGNVQLFVFFSLCVFAFVVGVKVWDMLVPPRTRPSSIGEPAMSRIAFILLPLTALTAVSAYSSWAIIRNNSLIILLLMSQQGEAIKESGVATGAISISTPLLIGVIWWAYWRHGDIRWKRGELIAVRCAIAVASCAVLVAAALAMSRSQLLTFSTGIAILIVFRRSSVVGSRRRDIAMLLGCSAISVVLLFLAFAFVRGTQSSRDLLGQLIGYTIASYNRLAAILDGSMRYPYAGRGTYLSGALSFSHFVNNIIPYSHMVGAPDYLDQWYSEFGAVDRAGLSGRLIWSGAFGYMYSDLGWFTPMLLALYGLLYGGVWSSMRQGRVLGLLLYPWCGFCVLFWVGSNYLLDFTMVVFLFEAIVLSLYERVFTKRTAENANGIGLSRGNMDDA